MKLWQKLGLVVATLALGANSVQAQTSLRFKFKEGDKLAYVLDQKMKMSSNVMGKDIEMHMNQSMTMDWKVLKVDGSGNAQVKMDFTGVKMEMDGPMGKIMVDSKDAKQPDDPVGKILGQVVGTIAGMEMSFTIDPTGHIKNIKVPDAVKNKLKNMPGAQAMGDLFSDDGLKKMAGGGVVLPAEAVMKGKSWTQKADMKMPIGQVKGDIQFTYDGPVEKDGTKMEKIALKPNIKIEAGPNAPFKMTMKEQTGDGYVYFDNAAGRLAEVTSNQKLEMTIDAANMTILQRIDQSTMMKLVK